MKAITTGDMMHVHGGFGAGVDYTVRTSVRLTDAVDAAVLRRALDRTQRRYPYLSLHLRRGEDAYCYEDNPLPIALLHEDGPIRLNAEETNFQVWAVCWWEDRIHLDVYHGAADGTGMYALFSTLLYYYCAERYGLAEHTGIRTLDDPISPEETADPQDALLQFDLSQLPAAQMDAAFTLETDGGLTPSAPTIWDLEIPEDVFLRFTSANDASPGTMVSLLFARAIDTLYPQREKDIVSAYVINARPMLHAPKTHHNCLSMALFRYSERVKAMPLARQCTVYRGMTFLQSDEERVAAAMTANAAQVRAAAQAAATLEEKKEAFGRMFNGGEGVVSFLVSYTGKWPYPALGEHMRELWSHPPNTFSLLVEIGAAGGKIFLSIQQRFREDSVREAFLRQLEENGVPYTLRRVMPSDVATFPEP